MQNESISMSHTLKEFHVTEDIRELIIQKEKAIYACLFEIWRDNIKEYVRASYVRKKVNKSPKEKNGKNVEENMILVMSKYY